MILDTSSSIKLILQWDHRAFLEGQTVTNMDYLFEILYRALDVLLPFEWAGSFFMKRALLEVLLVTPLCSVVGIQVVNYRLAFFSDAISHSAFTGIALGLLLGLDLFLTTVVFGLIVALGMAKCKTRSDLPMDSIIGVFFAMTVALGIAIISVKKTLSQTLPAFLFGDVLTISQGEIVATFTLFLIVLVFIAFSYNRLFLIGLNEPLARSQYVPVHIYNYIFSLILATVVTLGIRSIGILLITALLVVPAASARNVSRNARQMFWYSLLFGWMAGLSGLLLSFYADIAAGAAVILIASILFFCTFVAGLARKQGP